MKAIACTKYGPPEVLKLQDVEKPSPGKNEILIKIRATGVTASDCIGRGFKVPLKFWIPMWIAIGFRGPRRPILGMVLAGEVESVGSEVTVFKPGDKVYGCDFDRFKFSMYAEYVTIPESGTLAPMPEGITFEEAAALPYGAQIALHFLRKGKVGPGQKIMIYGASGAIGTAAVQLAKQFGAEVTGVCSGANVELVKSLGADHVIDYTREDFTKNGQRYDLILNAVGKAKVRLSFSGSLTSSGRHITVDDGSPKTSVENLHLIKELVEAGEYRPVIDRTFILEQMVEAHRYVDQGHKKGNVAITVP